MREQVDEVAATSGDGKASEAIGEIVSGGDEVDAPRGEAAVGSAANEGSSAMAAASSGGEADELIGEMTRSEVDEKGDAMETVSGGGEASEPEVKKKKKSKWTKTTKTKKSHDQRKVERRDRANGGGG